MTVYTYTLHWKEMAQLKNQNIHKMAPRGEEENGVVLAGT